MKNIFVSSTFRDMQAERDLVQEEVLPSLRNKAREYGENINMVDLRWGVDTSELESEEGSMKIMSVCLEEVEKSRPYMLIFLGERYGSIIDPAITRKVILHNKQGFELEDYAISITAMEVEFGALSEKYGNLDNCVVCVRDFDNENISNIADRAVYSAENEALARKQEAFKQKLISKLQGRVIRYTCDWDENGRRLVNLRTLDGECLTDRLVKTYERMFLPEWEEIGTLSWEDKEQIAVDAIKESKLSSFRGRHRLIGYYFNKIIQEGKPLVLQGRVGSGKTSIMCKLMDMLELRGYNVFRFVAGNSSGSENALQLVQQMVYYLEKLLELGHYKESGKRFVGAEEEVVGFRYSEWLERLRELAFKLKKEEKVYFFIDAVDQMFQDEHMEQLEFVLDNFCMRYVISCTDKFQISKTYFDIEKIPSLDVWDVEDVVEGILSSMHRNVYKDILNEIVLKKSSKNPLYISMLIQRLNMMGFDELFEAWTESDIIEHGCLVIQEMPDDEEDAAVFLINQAIKRVSDNFVVLKDITNLLAISRNGMREMDILAIVNRTGRRVTQLELSRLLCYLNTFFYTHKDGRINFTHKIIRQGILKEIGNGREYERQIKDYLKETEKENEFRIQEGMYYARIFQEYRFAKLLMKQACREEREELRQSLKKEAIADKGVFYSEVIARTSAEEFEIIDFVQNKLLREMGILKEELSTKERIADALMRRAETLYTQSVDSQRMKELYISYICVGEVSEELILPEKAFSFYWEGLRIARVLFDRKCGKEEQNNINYLCNKIGKVLVELNKNKEAYDYFFMGKKIAQDIYEKEHDEKTMLNYIISITNLGDAYIALDDMKKALSCYGESVNLLSLCNERTSLEKLEKVASVHKKIGNILINQGRKSEAISYLKKSIDYYELIYSEIGGERTLQELSDAYEVLGDLFNEEGENEKLTECYKKRLRYLEVFYERLPNNKTLKALCDLCEVLYKNLQEQMKFEEAASYWEIYQLHKDKIKSEVFYEVNEYMTRASLVIVVDYRGLTVDQDTILRRSIRNANGLYKLYTISQIKDALSENIIKMMGDESRKGIAFILGFGEPADLLHALVECVRKIGVLNILGGIVNGLSYNKEELLEIGSIPKRDILISRLLGSIKLPITRFVSTLNKLATSNNANIQNGVIRPENETKKEDAEEIYCVDKSYLTGLQWEENNGEIIITGASKTIKELVIPSEINGMPVTAIRKCAFVLANIERVEILEGTKCIGYRAFCACRKLNKVILPNSVEEIETQAFLGCSNLTKIELPNKLKIIEKGVFESCSRLKEVMIPNSVVTIKQYAFGGCVGLHKVSLPDSVENIEWGVFFGCALQNNPLERWESLLAEKLQYVEQMGTIKIIGVKDSTISRIRIPAHINGMPVTEIAENAFAKCRDLCSINMMDCEYLISVNMPEGIKKIETAAFACCTRLQNINIPNSVVVIENAAFSDCEQLQEVYIPNNVEEIGDHAFAGCTQLQYINIPDNVKRIGHAAFSGCEALKKIRLPKNLSIIEDNAFSYCSSLEYIELPEGVTNIQQYAFNECVSLRSIVLPQNIEVIGDSAFDGCEKLESISFSESLKIIGESAFDRCTNLLCIELPIHIKEIHNSAFSGCTRLERVSFPPHLELIGEAAFWGCNNLISINIPNSVTSIGSKAFQECRMLSEIVLGTGIKKIERSLFSRCEALKKLCLPNNIEIIEADAFESCKSLEEIQLSNCLTVIGKSAFECCKSLMQVELPSSLEKIEWNAFAECAQLRTIEMKQGLRTIGSGAFLNCNKLERIELPDSVIDIGRKAFSGCKGLNNVILSEEIINIYDMTFYECSNLREINIPEKVESIGEKAFFDCRKLQSIKLSNGLKAIGDMAFADCRELESVSVPNGLQDIGIEVFLNCYNLSRVDLPDELLVRKKQLFSGCTKLLYTPALLTNAFDF